jgi:hypothetical protein
MHNAQQWGCLEGCGFPQFVGEGPCTAASTAALIDFKPEWTSASYPLSNQSGVHRGRCWVQMVTPNSCMLSLPCAVCGCRYMVIETRKDGTKFTNRALKDAAERQADVATRYEQLQKDLVAQVRRGAACRRCGGPGRFSVQ